MAVDLWGGFDDINENIKEPQKILKEQAQFLNTGLSGLVEGTVYTYSLNEPWSNFYNINNIAHDFNYRFDIISSFIPKYSYNLCMIAYGITMYPVAISVSRSIGEELQQSFQLLDFDTYIASNEEEFTYFLSNVFNTKEVRIVLKGLKNIANNSFEDSPFK